MKKALVIFLRVAFILIALLIAAFFGARFYFQHQSTSGIQIALETDEAPVIGDASRPFPIIEFFDYRCPHCSEMSRLVDEAVAGDPSIKIILRPTVLMDENSAKIAGLVLAADKQSKGATIRLHRKIMALSSPPDYPTVTALASAEGIDIAQAEKDAGDYNLFLQKNTKLLEDIGFYGVPALIIGDKGYIPRNEFPGINQIRLMVIDAKTRLGIKP